MSMEETEMKLKDLIKNFYSIYPITVKKGGSTFIETVIEKVTADELALNPEYKYLREMEIFNVRVFPKHVSIILK